MGRRNPGSCRLSHLHLTAAIIVLGTNVQQMLGKEHERLQVGALSASPEAAAHCSCSSGQNSGVWAHLTQGRLKDTECLPRKRREWVCNQLVASAIVDVRGKGK